LVQNGELAAVIDWGDITTGDAATDVASLWMLFDAPGARAAALNLLQADAALIARSKGWALGFGVLLLDTGRVDNPRHAAMGLKTLNALAAELLAS
jgi:aminoglycoside phosphotransferase (APT) family kinase protein